MKEKNLAYLKLLSESYPTIQSAATEIINLKAILNLPKGTEYFLSDIHGEYDAFTHLMNSASGVIKDKINEALPEVSEEEKNLLATIIYYPKEKLDYLQSKGKLNNEFYFKILNLLISVARLTCSKYTRSKVRKLISRDFVYIIEELLQQSSIKLINTEDYYNEIILGIIQTDRAKEFIEEVSNLIKKSTLDHIHILGDIYDRGAGAFRIMETIVNTRSIDITWGNHDAVYMGAATGNKICIANVIRTSCRYNTLSTLEEGYGISLRPLVTFALRTYGNDDCKEFIPKSEEAVDAEDYDIKVIAKMHKAISIIQLKLDGQLVLKHPNYKMNKLAKLQDVDFKNKKYIRDGKKYNLIVDNFPTIDFSSPYELTFEENELMKKLTHAFRHSQKLQQHVDFLFSHGSMYLAYNNNLLYHGCIPTNNDGTFTKFYDEIGKEYSGKEYLNYCDRKARACYYSKVWNSDETDFFYFLWCGEISPLYGKNDITTFERYFLAEEDLKDFPESKNQYYSFENDYNYCQKILNEFDIFDENGVIINGHMPVKIKKGESPIKAGGKLIIIDGGICKAYQKVTGIAGYTLVYNSYGLKLIAHRVFESKELAIQTNKDMIHSKSSISKEKPRKLIKETDNGKKIQEKIDDLMSLLKCYRQGLIKPRD
ncbi:fructose-1 6-bisphosphatase class 3 [Firmicutes bacterium CAG:345]|nr:fructose-1 6-bisphosphatase class 3 [Firmicutes bacterium CAG:345]